MKDDELEIWRRQWHSQPAVPIDLIRKVERQTVYMKLDWIAQVLPGLIGAGTTVAAIVMRTLPWILLTVGCWLFNLVGWLFMIRNAKGVWTPAAETTAAYLELSIERCRRKLRAFRYSAVMTPLLTAFVLIVDYQILASSNAFKTTGDYLVMAGAFLVAIAVVSVVMAMQAAKRKKTQAELAYLLNLQRQLADS